MIKNNETESEYRDVFCVFGTLRGRSTRDVFCVLRGEGVTWDGNVQS